MPGAWAFSTLEGSSWGGVFIVVSFAWPVTEFRRP
jgi:hypothetical protein